MTDLDLYLSWVNDCLPRATFKNPDVLSFEDFVQYYKYFNGGTCEKPFLTMERWKKIHAFYTKLDPTIKLLETLHGPLPEYIED